MRKLCFVAMLMVLYGCASFGQLGACPDASRDADHSSVALGGADGSPEKESTGEYFRLELRLVKDSTWLLSKLPSCGSVMCSASVAQENEDVSYIPSAWELGQERIFNQYISQIVAFDYPPEYKVKEFEQFIKFGEEAGDNYLFSLQTSGLSFLYLDALVVTSIDYAAWGEEKMAEAAGLLLGGVSFISRRVPEHDRAYGVDLVDLLEAWSYDYYHHEYWEDKEFVDMKNLRASLVLGLLCSEAASDVLSRHRLTCEGQNGVTELRSIDDSEFDDQYTWKYLGGQNVDVFDDYKKYKRAYINQQRGLAYPANRQSR